MAWVWTVTPGGRWSGPGLVLRRSLRQWQSTGSRMVASQLWRDLVHDRGVPVGPGRPRHAVQTGIMGSKTVKIPPIRFWGVLVATVAEIRTETASDALVRDRRPVVRARG